VAGGGGDTASFRQTRSLLLRGALSFISAKCRRLIYVLLFASLKCLNSEQKRIEMAPFYDFASGYDKQTQPGCTDNIKTIKRDSLSALTRCQVRWLAEASRRRGLRAHFTNKPRTGASMAAKSSGISY
jgi:hypothetical protein